MNFERLVKISTILLIYFIIVQAVPVYMNRDYALIIAKKMIAKYDYDQNNELSFKEFQNMLVVESSSYIEQMKRKTYY
jgi:hypothetical protein